MTNFDTNRAEITASIADLVGESSQVKLAWESGDAYKLKVAAAAIRRTLAAAERLFADDLYSNAQPLQSFDDLVLAAMENDKCTQAAAEATVRRNAARAGVNG